MHLGQFGGSRRAPSVRNSKFYEASCPVLTSTRYQQLEDNLKGLRRDSEKLKAVVTKYAHIHNEGAGRRLLFTLKESSGLTDLRRKIGLHEQMLQLWYMTLVYGSLRRLEGGQEDILKAIEAIKNWPPNKVKNVRRCLRKGKIETLEKELRQSGLKPEAVDAALGTAVDYVDASPMEKVRMESHVRSGAMVHPETSSYRPANYPQFVFNDDFENGYGPRSPPPPPLHLYRSKSSSARRPRPTFHMDDENDEHYKRDVRNRDNMSESLSKMENSLMQPAKERHGQEPMSGGRRDKKYPSYNEDTVIISADSSRPRRSSATAKAPPRSPLLVVPDTGPRHRPASYHSSSDRHERSGSDAGSQHEEQIIIVQDPPRKHRSSSQRSDRSNRDRRDSSTHSYTRRRSSSRGKDGEETGEGMRMVKKMDRIDSIPTQ